MTAVIVTKEFRQGDMFYLQDHLGSPIRLMGQFERGIAQGYDAFGVPVAEIPPNRQPFGFTGYLNDAMSGLYYAQARYYDAGAGRFTAQDVLRGAMATPTSLNQYAYCLNQPMTLMDKDGRSPSDVHSYHENWHTQSQWEPRPPREPLPEPPDWRTPWTERPSYCEVYVGRSPDVSSWEPWTPSMTHCPTHLSTPPYYADWHLPREPLPPWQPIDYVLNAVLTLCIYVGLKKIKLPAEMARAAIAITTAIGGIWGGVDYVFIRDREDFVWQEFATAVGAGALSSLVFSKEKLNSLLDAVMFAGGKYGLNKHFEDMLRDALTIINNFIGGGGRLCWA